MRLRYTHILAFLGICSVTVAAVPSVGRNADALPKGFPKVEPMPAAVREVPCRAEWVPTTVRGLDDPAVRVEQRARVFVLDQVENAGAEPQALPARRLTWSGEGRTRARQTGDVPAGGEGGFRMLSGPAGRRDWERWAASRAQEGVQAAFPEAKVAPGGAVVRYVTLWELREAEEREFGGGGGGARRVVRRERVRSGVSLGTAGYDPKRERFDPCTEKLTPL